MAEGQGTVSAEQEVSVHLYYRYFGTLDQVRASVKRVEAELRLLGLRDLDVTLEEVAEDHHERTEP